MVIIPVHLLHQPLMEGPEDEQLGPRLESMILYWGRGHWKLAKIYLGPMLTHSLIQIVEFERL